MARPSYGDEVKARVKRLFEALLAYVDGEFDDGDALAIEINRQTEHLVVIRTKLRILEELTARDRHPGELTKAQIREALNRLQDFLEILEDHRTATQGSEDWHFTLKLWHKDKEANLKQFDSEWDAKRPPKSQAVAAKNTTPPATPTPTPYENLNRRGVEREQFVGRDESLKELHNLLQRSTQVAITAAVVGMGGVGKSELALQYAREHLRTYPGGVCFLRGNDFVVELVQFARPLFFPNVSLEDFSLSEQVAYCWQHWAEGDVLLVLDDVTDYGQVKPYLPEPTRFKVLMTTRRQLGKPVQLLRLDVLDEVAALDLLKFLTDVARIEGELEDAKQLCRRLGYLPLALELVGRYLSQRPRLSLEEMLSRLEAKGLRHTSLEEAKAKEMTAERGVRAAFELSWEALNDHFKAQQLGCLLSLFALAAIPWVLVERSAPEEEAEELEDAGVALEELHLLQAAGEETYQLHQLIREFFREKLEGLAEADVMKRAFAAVMVAEAREIPPQPTLELIESLKPAIPHLEEVASQLTDWLSDQDSTWPFTGLGRFYIGQGFYQLAEPWLGRCTEVAKSRFGAEHPDVAASLNNLALLYQSQGRYSGAEPLLLQALDIYQRSLPPDHPEVATSLNNLAQLYFSQGRYNEAEPLLLQALDIYQRSLPPDHPKVATSLNNLALLYQSQGRYSEAEPLYLQVLDIDQRSLPPDHPQLATHLNNLAQFYSSQGRYSEAESLYLQVLDIDQRSLPPDHPQLATHLSSLAGLYSSQGRYSEAEPLYLQVLDIDQCSLPPDHPEVATSLRSLAGLYSSQGRYSEAEPLYLQVLDIDQRSLPPDHPEVATSLRSLAGLYYSQGHYSGAEPLYLQALDIYQRSLPPDHPEVAISLSSLAHLYFSQGRYSEAESFYLQALDIYQRSLPPDHPGIASHLNNLAQLYSSQGRYSEAESFYLQALDIYQRSLPPDHPDVAISLNNLAELYRAQGRYSEAEPLYLQALDIDQCSLPPDHPEVASHLNNLAELYRAQGRYSEAEPLYLQALDIAQRSLPPDHPQLATSLNNLAGLYRAQGRYSEAEPLYLKSLEILQRSLPENHPYITTAWRNLALFWIAAINEGRASLEQLLEHPLRVQIWAQIQVLEQES
jgi:tetratricopeptide (TPR) repeat protein